jgi:hypothetical protein
VQGQRGQPALEVVIMAVFIGAIAARKSWERSFIGEIAARGASAKEEMDRLFYITANYSPSVYKWPYKQ